MTLAFEIQAKSDVAVSFKDIDENHKMWEYLYALASNKIVGGYSDGEFKLGRYVTRAEFAKFVSNSLTLND